MNDANFTLQRNDGKTPWDICNDEALDWLFQKYESAAKVPAQSSNDNIAIVEEDDEGDSEEETKIKPKWSKGEGFEMKFGR